MDDDAWGRGIVLDPSGASHPCSTPATHYSAYRFEASFRLKTEWRRRGLRRKVLRGKGKSKWISRSSDRAMNPEVGQSRKSLKAWELRSRRRPPTKCISRSLIGCNPCKANSYRDCCRTLQDRAGRPRDEPAFTPTRKACGHSPLSVWRMSASPRQARRRDMWPYEQRSPAH